MTVAPMRLDLKREHQVYRTKDGNKVPGVTSILGVYSKEALLGWYAAEEREGILGIMGDGVWSADRLRTVLPTKDGKPSWFAVQRRDKAADLGTIAHAHIEARLSGTTLDHDGLDIEMWKSALVPAERFFGWVDEHKVTLVRSEFQMVSEFWKVGGTGDCFFTGPDGLTEYWDVKTGKPWYKGVPYDEQIAQSAAYANFYTELTGIDVARIRIARVGKTEGDSGNLYPVSQEARGEGMELFGAAVKAYAAKHRLSKALKQ